jgi:outer membrane protein assembly factor BamB
VALADGVLHTTWTVGLGATLLRALDATTGATLWTVGGAPNLTVSVVAPVVANGAVFVSRLSEVTAHHP